MTSYSLRYLGTSGIEHGPYRSTLRFRPNLGRERVFFGGRLADPLRFREAISALHDVVVGDLRFQKRDKSRYLAWQAQEAKEALELRKRIEGRELDRLLAELPKGPPPAGLEEDFRRLHRTYWNARVKWANELARNDPELFRHLVPCDPVVTVADDVVYFEAFSKDESSYGCLFVERDAFLGAQEAALGTTNVDYSLALYEHFQELRTYRETRLEVDPQGFEVKVEGASDLREEKIDLPASWLRGFGQISAATGVPSERIQLDRGAVYSVLAFLVRHREKRGPRSIVFELRPGKPIQLKLEPWGTTIVSSAGIYTGAKEQHIKVWGRRRLLVLARLLPWVTSIEVQLLGSGLPSLWTLHLGGMRFVLALSGWTANDWSSGTNLDLLTGAVHADAESVLRVQRALRARRLLRVSELAIETGLPSDRLAAALHRSCKEGQCIFDIAKGAYRFRDVIEAEVASRVVGPDSPELIAARELFVGHGVQIERDEVLSQGKHLLVAKVRGERCETVLDADGGFSRARCSCTHFRRFGLRNGACRHLLALRFNRIGSAHAMLAAGSIGGGFLH